MPRYLHGDGGHYSLVNLESFEEIKGLVADEINWIFTGTSGVHGLGTKASDYLDESQYTWLSDKTVRDSDGEEYQPSITVLVIHPRLVCTRYGHFKVTKQDLLWLRAQELNTLQAINSKWSEKEPHVSE